MVMDPVNAGTEALFTSMAGGKALRARILALIDDACVKAQDHSVDVNIMTFSFTDSDIADALATAAEQPGLTIRLIADWTQRAADGCQQVGRLADLGSPSLQIRYKKDQPYVWDATDARIRWSYRASRGMLHHKTLSVIVDGEPWRLACGSSNWTDKAAQSYENLLILSDSTPGCRDLMSRVELEFEALWSDGTASLSAVDAQTHYETVVDSYRRNALSEPATITGLARGRAEALQLMNPQYYSALGCASPPHAIEADAAQYDIAFSARRPDEMKSRAGYSELTNNRLILMTGPTGRSKVVPLTITNLALDFIFRSQPGETLLVAMYGLSTRVPEYGALLHMARRGVHLRILLDGKVGRHTAEALSRVCGSERLPIQVRHGYRTMHQKYVVNIDSADVLTGTANMSTDASARHSEHRLRMLGHGSLARQFAADFETIWSRVDHLEKREGEPEAQSRNPRAVPAQPNNEAT
jgi:phosphatidylserine/phosphatidylglycerophosphate/cardiolipin synthase-like enzyme